MPYFANLGRNPRILWIMLPLDGRPLAALMQVLHLSVLHDLIVKDIRWAKEKIKCYYDLKRGDMP
jgi:hypothetical protein